MRRTTYTIAGQAVAVRVHVIGVSNNVLHLHNDHLGSNSVMSYHSNGSPVPGSCTRYLPFGGYRTAPTQTFTDRGYTGHLHNDGLGLIYMNARFFIPSIGRFASADTLVPQPGNPQSFNRFSYVVNNPLNLIDPTGHIQVCPVDTSCDPGDSNSPTSTSCQIGCVDLDTDLGQSWTTAEETTILAASVGVSRALAATENTFRRFQWKLGLVDNYDSISPRQAFLAVFGGPVTFVRKSFECDQGCFGRTISAQEIWVYSNASTDFSKNFIVHEYGHAFENALEAIVGFKPPRNLLAQVQESNPNFPNRFVNGQAAPYGFAGNFPGWQQSQQADAYEEFADMFIGWTYNTWAANAAGRDRAGFMKNMMPLWVDLAISE